MTNQGNTSLQRAIAAHYQAGREAAFKEVAAKCLESCPITPIGKKIDCMECMAAIVDCLEQGHLL